MSDDRSSAPPPSNEAPSAGGLSRRAFIGGLAGAALLPLAGSAGASPTVPLTPEQIEAWKKTLFEPGEPFIYSAIAQPQAAFPTGGIGCGNVYLGVGGHLKDWLIFNNTGPVQVPNTFFGASAWADLTDEEPIARVLQTESRGLTMIGQFGGTFLNGTQRVPQPGPGIADAQLSGEYPHAALRYLDPALPVEITLETFTPWVPHDAKTSAMPGAVFLFRVHNPGAAEMRVRLLAAVHNAAGLGSDGRSANFNELCRDGDVRGIRLASPPGKPAQLGAPVELVALPGLELPGVEQPADLRLRVTKNDSPAAADFQMDPDHRGLIWLEDPASLAPAAVDALRAAVEGGATLVLSGTGRGLLESWAATRPGADFRLDIPFDDFESGTYDNWSVTGTAFEKRPQQGTLPGQQAVSGFRGKFLINSFTDGDTPTGRMLSAPFPIVRRYIRFLIGGGNNPGRTCVNLLVDGKVVRTATGKNLERLEPHAWDVSEFAGKQGRLEIVDRESGGWGHINIDEIMLSDLAGEHLAPEVAKRLSDLLPISFDTLAWHPEPVTLQLEAREQAPAQPLEVPGQVEFKEAKLQPGSGNVAGGKSGVFVWQRPVGKGRVVLMAAPLLPREQPRTRPVREAALRFLAWAAGLPYEAGSGLHEHSPSFGELALATRASHVTGLLTWDDPAALWKAFAGKEGLPPLPKEGRAQASSERSTNAALSVEFNVRPRKEVLIPFFLTWHFPNYYFGGARVGNRYTQYWKGAAESAAELAKNWRPLHEQTQKYRKAAYESTLPYYLTDCLTSQSSTIRSEVCIWLEDGTFAGFEGADGCCPMNCSHVWGYEQSLSRLFPDLEKSMREADFKHQQRPDGGLNNRIALPLQPRPTGEMPFADGHASGILKAYREHLNSPDSNWLREYWPRIKKAVEYLVNLDRGEKGQEPDGILEGPQWNTYDCVVFGPNSFIGTYYLAALRAGEEMAKLMDEPAVAAAWRKIFETGSKRLVELCWNGEYYTQNLPGYEKQTTQWGHGCLSDQLIGQWWAHQLRLGYLLPQEQVRTALAAVLKHNWRWDFADFKHRQRTFADQHDKGLLNCTWPKGGRPPNPILYCDEVWTGVEYQVAGHMVYEGMLEEAFTIVRGARERYDGRRRNPWNEIECGGHYARAMANWSILTGLSGYHHDGPRGLLCFDPVLKPEEYRSLFTVAEGWGSFSQERKNGRQRNELRLDHGRAVIRRLELGVEGEGQKVAVSVGGRKVAATPSLSGKTLALEFPVTVEVPEGQTLRVEIG